MSVDRRWVDQGSQSFWSFCIDFIPAVSKAPSYLNGSGNPRERIDYRDKLPPDQFRVLVKADRAWSFLNRGSVWWYVR